MHTPTQCDACGAWDDHPKLHYVSETYHHDCIPFKVMRDLTTTGYWEPVYGVSEGKIVVVDNHWVEGEEVSEKDLHPEIKKVFSFRTAAMDGTRGDKLRALIQKKG